MQIISSKASKLHENDTPHSKNNGTPLFGVAPVIINNMCGSVASVGKSCCNGHS